LTETVEYLIADLMETTDSVRREAMMTHQARQGTFMPEMIDQLAQRCTESESGARNVEAVLRNSLKPALSQKLLEALASGQEIRRAQVGSGEEWQILLG